MDTLINNLKVTGTLKLPTSAASYGIVGDGVVLSDVSATSGSPTVTSAGASFVAADVGKAVTLYSGKHQSFACSFTGSSTSVTCSSTTNLVAGMRVSACKSVATTGNLTSNSTTISNLGTTTGLVVGMVVSGDGIPGGVTISSINTGASSMVISDVATGTGTGVSLTFSKYIVPLDATIASITNSTTFVLSAAATNTLTGLTADFVPGYLQTTVSAVNSATSITLANNAAATVTNGRLVYGTDNTSALTSALSTIKTAGGGKLQFDHGLYIIAGALQDGSVRNAVILVPNDTTGQITSLELCGPCVPALESNGFLDYPPSLTGAVIFCPTAASGTDPCMFGGNCSASPGAVSSIVLRCADLTFRRPQWSLLGEFNFRTGGALAFERCVIEPDYVLYSEFLAHAYPSAQTSIIFPNSNNGGYVRFISSRIGGSGTAIKGAQHLSIINSEFAACRVAVMIDSGGGGGSIEAMNCHMVGCGYNFYVPSGGVTGIFSVFGTEFENQAAGPFVNFWDFYDESGSAMSGNCTIVLLASAQARVSSSNTCVSYISGSHREMINPPTLLLSDSQYLVLRGNRDGAGMGFQLQGFDATVLGFALATPSFGGQFILQSGNGKTVFVRNNSGVGLSIDPTTGQIVGSTLKLSALPTSASGLSSGEIWSNSNVLTKA